MGRCWSSFSRVPAEGAAVVAYVDRRAPDSVTRRRLIYSLAASPLAVRALGLVVTQLRQNTAVHHIGLGLDEWYRNPTTSAFHREGAEVVALPRPSGRTTAWWATRDIDQEFASACRSLSTVLEQHARFAAETAGALMITDDRGPIEVLAIDCFERLGVPVFLIQHGPSVPFVVNRSLRVRVMEAVRTPGEAWRAIGARLQSSFIRPSPLHIRPAGHNGAYQICSYSEHAMQLLLDSGVASSRIFPTGYPYLDDVFVASQVDTPSPQAPSIMCISSGWGMFGATSRARAFYSCVANIARRLSHEVAVSVRPKPGEDIALTCGRKTAAALQRAGVIIESSDQPLYAAALKHSLVVGDASSGLLEAVIVGRPVGVVGYESYQDVDARTLEAAIRRVLQPIELRVTKELRSAVESALAARYSEDLRQRMFDKEAFFFHKLDGRASVRVAQVIEKRWAQQKTSPIYLDRPENYLGFRDR